MRFFCGVNLKNEEVGMDVFDINCRFRDGVWSQINVETKDI